MSVQVPKGYKQTEVGVIPEDWTISPIGDVATTGSGTTPSRALYERYFKNGNINWVKTLDLNNSAIKTTDEQVTEFALSETSLKIYPVNTVLIAMYGGFNQIGRTGILAAPACVNQALTAVKVSPKIISKYLLYTLNYKNEYWKSVASSSRKDPNITSKDVKDFLLAFPCPQEQQAIAEALSDADALIESLEQLIVKKRQIKQGAMQELLTGLRRLPGFSGEWNPVTLGQLGKCLRGVSYKGSVDLFDHDNDRSKRLLRSNNVQRFSIDEADIQFVNANCVSNDQILKNNDILICMANGSKDLVGKSALFNLGDGFEYTFGAFMGCLRLFNNLADSKFVSYLMQTSSYRTQINNLLAGSSINNLTPTSIESLEFLVPSKDEQVAISLIIGEMDKEIESLKARLMQSRKIKQSMMQELLTGRIRLI